MTTPLQTFPHTATQRYLASIGACKEARAWVGTRTLQEAWYTCECIDWLHFLLYEVIWAEFWELRAAPNADYSAIFADRIAKRDALDACTTCNEVRAKFECPTLPPLI